MNLDRIMDAVDKLTTTRRMNKLFVIFVVLAVLITVAAGVVRALKGQSLISYEQINVGNEIQITADDAIEGSGRFRWDKLVVESGQQIVIDSELEEAGIEVCIMRGASELYDQTVEGAQIIEIEVDPGAYEVGAMPKDRATGTMSICAR